MQPRGQRGTAQPLIRALGHGPLQGPLCNATPFGRGFFIELSSTLQKRLAEYLGECQVNMPLPIAKTKPSPILRLLPIPLLEEVRDGKSETRQEVFAVQFGVEPQQFSLGQRVADLHAFLFWMNDPGDLIATPKKLFQSFVHLPSGIRGREDFHRQIGSAGEEPPTGGFKTQALQARFGNE